MAQMRTGVHRVVLVGAAARNPWMGAPDAMANGLAAS